MTDLNLCMDLIEASPEDIPKHSFRVREIPHAKSCQDFSLCTEQDGATVSGKFSRILLESSYSRLSPFSAAYLKQPYLAQTKICVNIKPTKQLRNSSKPSPRVLYNFCIGRITDLESRAAETQSSAS